MRREGDRGEQIPGWSDEDRDHFRTIQRQRQARVAKLVVALLLVIVFVVFIVQNSDRTGIDYVFFHRETRLIWIMLACGIVGGIVGFLVGRPGKQIRLHGRDKEKKS